MPVEWRTVLFAEMQLRFGIVQRRRMLPAARHEEILIQNPVIFIRHQIHDHAETFAVRHVQQILRRVAQIAAVIHVDVSRSAPPARGYRGRMDQLQRHLRCLARLHLHGRGTRLIFKPAHRFHRHSPRWNLHAIFALCMKAVLSGSSDAGICIRRRIELAVGCEPLDARRTRDTHLQPSHGAFPVPRRYAHLFACAAVCLEQCQLRQPPAIREISDPFAVRRPARMKMIPPVERQLVWRAPRQRNHVQVMELVRCASGRRINDPLAVDRNLRPRAIKRLLG